MMNFVSTAYPVATPAHYLHNGATQAFVVRQPKASPQSEIKDGVIVTSSPQNPVTPPATSASVYFTRREHISIGGDDMVMRGNTSEKVTTSGEKATYDIPHLFSQADAATADSPIVFPYPPEALTFAQVAEFAAALNRNLGTKTADTGRGKGQIRCSQSGLLAEGLSVVVGASVKSAGESGGGGAKIFIGGLKYQLLMGNKAAIAWLVAVLTGGIVSLPESFITIHSKRKVVSVGKPAEGTFPVGTIASRSSNSKGKQEEDPNRGGLPSISLPTGCASIFVPNTKDVDHLLSMHRRAFCGPDGVMITGASSETEELIRRLSSTASISNNSTHRGPAHPIVIERASGSGRPTTAQPVVNFAHFGREGKGQFYSTPAVLDEGNIIQRNPNMLNFASHQQHSFAFLGYGLDTDQQQKEPYQSSIPTPFNTPQTTCHAFVGITSNFCDESPVLRTLSPQLSSGDVNLPRTLNIRDEGAMPLNYHEELTHAHGSRNEQQLAYSEKNINNLRANQLQLQSLLQSAQSLSHGNLTNEIVSEQLRVVANLQHQLSIVQNLQQQQKNLFESQMYHGGVDEGAGGVVDKYGFSTPMSTGKYAEEAPPAHIHATDNSSSSPQVHVPAVSSSPHVLSNPAFYGSVQPSFPYALVGGFAGDPSHSVYNEVQTSPSLQSHISSRAFLGPYATNNLNLCTFLSSPPSGDPTRIGTASNNRSIGLHQEQHIHYQHHIEAQHQHQRLQEQIRALGQHARSTTAGVHQCTEVHDRGSAGTFLHAAQRGGGGGVPIQFSAPPFYHVPEQMPTGSSISNPSGTLWRPEGGESETGYALPPPFSLPHGGMTRNAYGSVLNPRYQ